MALQQEAIKWIAGTDFMVGTEARETPSSCFFRS